MSLDHFYSDLPTLETFLEITYPQNFVSVPDEWFIIVTDICGSTKAIESGRYKDVNLLGAASIVVALNFAGAIEIPYVFGGDGASILIPPSLLRKAQKALPATQKIAKTEFGMDLRVGIVPVTDVTKAGYDVKVAKLKISENYSQGIFTGGGLNYATDLVKDVATAHLYMLNPNPASKADFSGLECRWADIPSRHGEIVSLLVLATTHNEEKNYSIYREVLEKIWEIYGDDQHLSPISSSALKLAFSRRKLMSETKLRAKSSGWFDQQLYLFKIRLENLLGLAFMKFKAELGGVNWGLYQEIVTASTDYKKFDDMLRMIISGDAVQRELLTNYLEKNFREGKLVYGLHASDRALMTCVVFERNGRQVHFIDGADGGYALAAKPLKQRMKQKALNWRTFTQLVKLRKRIPS